ncbi:MAG: hypothetical protein ACYDBB_25125, partial [Armatimonadota bacterium]
MKKYRKHRYLFLLLLPAVLLVGYWRWPRSSAVFTGQPSLTVLDADTIQVDGTRIPGGPGIWRYHLITGRWESVPSRVIRFPSSLCIALQPTNPGMYYLNPTYDIRLPLDIGSAILYRANGEPTNDDDGFPDRETIKFIEYRVRDGKQTVLGTIRHVPVYTWKMLPDGSGFWVKEECPTIQGDWIQPVIHIFTFQTHRWKTIRCQNIYCEPQDSWSREDGCSMIQRQGNWVLVFNNEGFIDAALTKSFRAELWVNLGTGAVRLGEPSSDPLTREFSPDGQYCFMEETIMPAPHWPQGAGLIGKTYSVMPKIGSLPVIGWGTDHFYWLADSRHLVSCDRGLPTRVSNLYYELRDHLKVKLPDLPRENLLAVTDLTGKVVGRILRSRLKISILPVDARLASGNRVL